MAKRNNKILNKDEINNRAKRIVDCATCKGSPPIKECNLQGLHFNCCDLCLEIVGDYQHTGTLIKVKEIPSAQSHTNLHYDPTTKFGPISLDEITPGEI